MEMQRTQKWILTWAFKESSVEHSSFSIVEPARFWAIETKEEQERHKQERNPEKASQRVFEAK